MSLYDTYKKTRSNTLYDTYKKSRSSGDSLGGYKSPKVDLGTSEGLQTVAKKSGLETQVKRVLSTKGEDINKIFSGGFISDIFDGLNALQYGVAGVLQGKGFAEGVKTRASFSDKDQLGKHGLAGTIGGIALDIAVDPLTYIAPWTVLKKIGVAPKLIKAAKIAEGTKTGQYLGNKFVYMFGKDPIYREMFEKSVRNIQAGNTNIAEIGKKIIALPKETAQKLLTKDKDGRIARVGLSALKNTLNPKEYDIVSQAWTKIDDLGKEAVNAGLLSKAKFEENFGEYIKNAYLEYETKKGGVWGSLKKTIGKQFGRKPELTPEIMAKLGQIDNAGYLFAKGSINLIKDIENAKFFKEVGGKFGSDVLKEGTRQIPKEFKYGALAGKYVPQNLFDDLTEIAKPYTRGTGEIIMGEFKKFKTIMNPATHVRNVISNQILNWWKLGIGPWRQDLYLSALNDIRKGTEIWKRAQKVGAGVDTFAANEIKDLITNPNNYKGVIGKARKAYDALGNRLGNLYQGEESVAKLVAFKEMLKKGLTDEEAWKMAEKATFNYAQVTPFVRKLRTSIWGYPFITFAMKAAPVAVETAFKYPRRISALGKIKGGVEAMSDKKETAKERANEPAWIRDGFYIKLPMKDEHGRSAYFDLTYILPFGDLVSGTFLTRQVNRETGLPESPTASLLEKNPALNVIKELGKNQDFYGDKIWRDSDTQDKQLGDIMRYILKTMTPPLLSDQIPGGWKNDGTRRLKGIPGGIKATPENQDRTLMQELLRNVGMKIQPINADMQEMFMEWEKKKAMETLLLERQEDTQFKKFEKGYISK